MRKIFKVFILNILVIAIVNADELPKYELNIPEKFTVEEYKNDLKSWRKSLFNGLGYEQNKVTEAIFLKTDIPIIKNGEMFFGKVYQNKDSQRQFYISISNTIIDFNLAKVGTMGVSGITQHPTPSGRMVIILAPQINTSLLGVTLDFTGKVQANPPTFSNNLVSYEWF